MRKVPGEDSLRSSSSLTSLLRLRLADVDAGRAEGVLEALQDGRGEARVRQINVLKGPAHSLYDPHRPLPRAVADVGEMKVGLQGRRASQAAEAVGRFRLRELQIQMQLAEADTVGETPTKGVQGGEG